MTSGNLAPIYTSTCGRPITYQKFENVGDFLLQPPIPGADCDAQDIDVRGLEQHHQWVVVSSDNAVGVLIEDDLLSFGALSQSNRADQGQR